MSQHLSIVPSLVWGGVALAVLWALIGMFGKSWNPLKLVEGADGRPSTSKLQWLIWTAVVYFSYTVVYATRARDGVFEAIGEVPQNVLYAMGFAAVTMAAAKGIKVGYINSGRLANDPVGPQDTSVAQLLTDDNGAPDLSKIQMIAWTLLASAIYLIRTIQTVRLYTTGDTDLSQLPDIDGALMVLMGLGQGAYLGKKVATTDTPRAPTPPGQGQSRTIAGGA